MCLSIIWATDQYFLRGQATQSGQCSGTVRGSAHCSGGAIRPGPGGAPEDLHPQEQSLWSGSLYVCWLAGFEIFLYRISFCLFPDDNEQGWVFPTLRLEKYSFSVSSLFWSFFSFMDFYLANLVWTFRLLICWVSRSPIESREYYYFCSLNCKWTLVCFSSLLSQFWNKGFKTEISLVMWKFLF